MRTEHQEQALVIQWARYAKDQIPELALLHAVPNGGDRNVIVAKKLKAEGVKAGVPDLHLPVARSGHHGLWVEMKRRKVRQTKTLGPRIDKTKPTAAQEWWIQQLREQGHAVEVCWSAEEAEAVILSYIAGRYQRQWEAE